MCIYDLLTINIVEICSVFQPMYRKLMPLYYPRSKKEERIGLPLLPADIGNAWGGARGPGETDRIAEKPGNLEGELKKLFSIS